MTVTVYTKPACVQCNQTKLHMKKRGIQFTEKLLEGYDLEAAKQLGYTSAPVVFAGDEHWSGYRPDRIDALLKDMEDEEQAS